MSEEFSRPRRIAAALIAVAVSALLLRSQIAEALVVRGDDYLYRGDAKHALERYGRALTIFPASGTAEDRYVFVLMQRHTPEALARAVAVADGYLAQHPDDADVLSDRALCYLLQKKYGAAQADFERAAPLARSPDDFLFAGLSAEHAQHRARARALWKAALRLDRRYRPALVALAKYSR